MNRVTRRAITISRRTSEYYVAKRGFRVVEEPPTKTGQKMSSTKQINELD